MGHLWNVPVLPLRCWNWLSLLLSQHGKREIAWHRPSIVPLVRIWWGHCHYFSIMIFFGLVIRFLFQLQLFGESQITRQFISTLMDSRKSLDFSLYTGKKKILWFSPVHQNGNAIRPGIIYEGQLSNYMSGHFNNFLSQCFSFQCFAWKQLCANSSYLAALALGLTSNWK